MAGKGRIENLTPFKPGQSGNPAGRAGILPPEIRKARKKNQAKVIELIAELLSLTDDQAKARVENPLATQLEHAAQALIGKARNGDVVAFRYMMDIACGKIPEHDYDGFSEEDLRILNRVKELLTERPTPSGSPGAGSNPGH